DSCMRRRDFIKLIGGGAAAWPVGALGQQPERVRLIAILMGLAEDDPETKKRLVKFRSDLEKLGWSEGRNIRIEIRFAPAGSNAQSLAKELVALQPDVLLAHSAQSPAPCSGKPARFRSYSSTSPRPRLYSQSGAAGRQFHRCAALRGRHPRQVGGDAQGNRAKS